MALIYCQHLLVSPWHGNWGNCKATVLQAPASPSSVYSHAWSGAIQLSTNRALDLFQRRAWTFSHSTISEHPLVLQGVTFSIKDTKKELAAQDRKGAPYPAPILAEPRLLTDH